MTYKPEKQMGGRLEKSDLEWAADKLLKGAGTGANPTEIDVETANSILQKIQQFKGVFWFNNHWLPAGMVGDGASGTGAIAYGDYMVWLQTGATLDSHVYARKNVQGFSEAVSWDKKRYFGCHAEFLDYSAQNIHIVTGYVYDYKASGNPSLHVGFKLINDVLYGTVADGTTESTLALETLTAASDRCLEVVFAPASEARFYVGGVDKGTTTTNLPSGTSNADRMLDASIHNTEAVSKEIYIYESRTLQEE